MSRIQLLDDVLISKIAAGEVVERPSSVVKELVENSLDAGATDVSVDLEVGGKRRIVITDNGHGMDADDALLAFDRHATSKIATFEDLEQVATLGFRGEALAAISAVARVEMLTATSPGDGYRVKIEGGRVKKVEPAAHPKGTRLEVASLFWNVPARRKFLKKPVTEMRRAVEVVQGYALAHPETRFTVRHDKRLLFETLPLGDTLEDLRERIGQVFGRTFSEALETIPEDFITETESISGFIGDKSTSRGRKTFVYVNRRLVRDRAVLARFYRAVKDEWKSDEFPSLFLFLDLLPDDVDVNVHPQKSEVRFRHPAFLDQVEEALRQTLALLRGEEAAAFRVPQEAPTIPPAWEGLGGRKHVNEGQGEWSPASYPASSPAFEGTPSQSSPTEGPFAGEGQFQAVAPTNEGAAPMPVPGIAQATYKPMVPQNVPLSGRSGEVRPFRLLAQYKGSMILLEGPDGLYIIDQHVAHERILYERLRRSFQGQTSASQALLTPPLLDLAPAEAMRLGELADALEPCGFTLVPMSGNSVALQAIPTMLSIDEAVGVLQELAVSQGEGDAEVEAEKLHQGLLEALAASMSCKAAIKIHRPLPVPEMERLITELFEAEQPYSCPHGRPTVLKMSDVEIERRFGRRGAG